MNVETIVAEFAAGKRLARRVWMEKLAAITFSACRVVFALLLWLDLRVAADSRYGAGHCGRKNDKNSQSTAQIRKYITTITLT